MKLLLRFVDLLLYTSLFTACCATGLCMATEQFICNSPPAPWSQLHLLLFGGTLVVYNLPRLVSARVSPKSSYYYWYLGLFAAGLCMVLPCIFRLRWQIMLLSLVMVILTTAYSLPLLPFKNKKRLREFGWVKILVLAGVWTVATSLLPVIYWQKNPADYPFEVLTRFVFIFTLCVVFDIRDMHADRNNNITTVPHKLGLENSYRMINMALLVFVVLSVVQYLRYPVAERLVAAWATALVTWLVVVYLKKKPSERAYMGLADGVMLVYAFLVWVL